MCVSFSVCLNCIRLKIEWRNDIYILCFPASLEMIFPKRYVVGLPPGLSGKNRPRNGSSPAQRKNRIWNFNRRLLFSFSRMTGAFLIFRRIYLNVFKAVKQSVTTRQAAEHFGIRVGRNGMCVCPFHADKNPSMKVDRRFHCFGCQADGDVIDFVGRLFQLSPYDAARKLMADFHLSPDKPPSAAALHAKRIRTEAQQLMENERLCFSVLSDYARVLRRWKVQYCLLYTSPSPRDS